MLALSDPTQCMRRDALDTPGGFAWWYVDLLDHKGDGIVMIWAFGLPFLPGYRSSTKGGKGPVARMRPSLNVATYRAGRPDLYLLQEWPDQVVQWGANSERVTFGDESTLLSTVTAGRRCLRARLTLPLPGTKELLTGEVDVEGPVCRLPTPTTPDSVHHWSPLTTATRGRARLRVGNEQVLDLEGRAYHDRNESTTPLDSLGIKYWMWGRTPVEDGEVLHYVLWPEGDGPVQAHAWHVSPDGTGTAWTVSDIDWGPRRRSFYGMRHHPTLRLQTDAGPLIVNTHRLVDDGPFYLRMLTHVSTPAGSGQGVGEAIVPDRVDLPVHRPFVRMRVHDLGGANSIWLPLFSGPAAGRFRRLFGPRGTRRIVQSPA